MYFLACDFFPVCLNRSLLPWEKLGDIPGTRRPKGPFPSSFSALPKPTQGKTLTQTQALPFWPSKKITQFVIGTCCSEGGICVLLATGNRKTSRP